MATEELRPTYRSSRISNRDIALTEEEPLERLKQLCNQGYYKYHYTWDTFQNGIMCELELTYTLSPQSSRRSLIKETRFVEGNDLGYAKKVLAAVLIERLGLGVVEQESPITEAEEKMQDLAEKGMDFALAAFGKMMSTVPGHTQGNE
jgi:hypothetical protein